MTRPTTTPTKPTTTRKPAASTRYCPKCKAQTDHAIVIQIATGHVARAWQCLTCWRIHD